MIPRKDFEDEVFKTYRGCGLKILDFLKNNKDNAYTIKDISKEIQVSVTSITFAMRKLVKNGLVEGKRPYYIIKRDFKKKNLTKPEEEKLEETEYANDANDGLTE